MKTIVSISDLNEDGTIQFQEFDGGELGLALQTLKLTGGGVLINNLDFEVMSATVHMKDKCGEPSINVHLRRAR